MKSGIRNLLLASCFLFSVSYDCCTMGVDYDNRYKLSPEFDTNTCLFTFEKVYGKRWERLGSVTFFLGVTLIIAAGAAWRREEESGNNNLSILIQRE